MISIHRSFKFVFCAALVGVAGCTPDAPETEVDPRIQGPLFELTNFNEIAPEVYSARFETTKGTFVVQVHRKWAPIGASRFYNLVRNGWYDGVRIHRVLKDFTAGFGIHDDPYVNAVWRRQTLKDDPRVESNTRGRVTFAKSQADTRTVQVFVNLKDNSGTLNGKNFAPFGEVVSGMEVLGSLYSGYGDGPPRGEGVYQAMAIAKGAEYFADFPELDLIVNATIVEGSGT
jgi:cyclophilin family peptidyl-prolyl cis-trans isomerase